VICGLVSPEAGGDTLNQITPSTTKEAARRATQGQRDEAEADRILRDGEVCALTGISRTTRWRLIREGRFPKPVRLTSTAIGWRASSVAQWIAEREVA